MLKDTALKEQVVHLLRYDPESKERRVEVFGSDGSGRIGPDPAETFGGD